MHHRSMIEIAFAAIGVTYEGGASHRVAASSDRGRDRYDHDEAWDAPVWFGSDDGQNGDGGA